MIAVHVDARLRTLIVVLMAALPLLNACHPLRHNIPFETTKSLHTESTQPVGASATAKITLDVVEVDDRIGNEFEKSILTMAGVVTTASQETDDVPISAGEEILSSEIEKEIEDYFTAHNAQILAAEKKSAARFATADLRWRDDRGYQAGF